MYRTYLVSKDRGAKHLCDDNDYVTYCGREADQFRNTKDVTFSLPIDDPSLCKQCKHVALS